MLSLSESILKILLRKTPSSMILSNRNYNLHLTENFKSVIYGTQKELSKFYEAYSVSLVPLLGVKSINFNES